jgi:flagellar protein FliO/FliZ
MGIRLISIIFPALVVAAPTAALAAAQSAQIASPGLLGGGFRLLAGLLLVVGLMLLLYALSRRGLNWLPKPRGGAIIIRETRHLGPKKSLCLVEVHGRELLLGIGGDRIELLCQLGEAPKGDFEAALQAGMKEPRS